MKAASRALLLLALVGVASLALAAVALPRGGIAGLLVESPGLAPPPQLRLTSPMEGEGGSGPWIVAGEARSATRSILDVQVRVDGGRWQSVPDLARGHPATPFATTLALEPGDHLLEARAYDGESYSMVGRALVRPGAPTVRVAAPADGASVPAGEVEVVGTLQGAASGVVVERAGVETKAVVTGASWRATLALPPGEHVLGVRALGEPGSLPRLVRVAAGAPPPPTILVTTPEEGASVGSGGDATCPGCFLFAGSAPGAADVLVELDGVPAGRAELAAPVWTWRLPLDALPTGEHRASFQPVDERGQAGVAREVRFAARTPRTLSIEGDAAPRATGTPLAFEAAGDAAQPRWTLDGEPIGNGARVEVVLERAGDHVLTLTGLDDAGRPASVSLPLHAFNRPPRVSLLRDDDPTTAAVLLRAQAEDPDGSVVAYAWSFGDNASTRTALPEVQHRYAKRGVYAVNVTAFDDLGVASVASLSVAVANVAPVVSFTWTPESPSIQDLVTFQDASLDADGGIGARAWTFPDGNESREASPTVRFATRGPQVVTLRVADAEGAQGLLARTVTVRNLPPTPQLLADPALPRIGQEVVFQDASVDLDGPIVSWRWEFGDGAVSTQRHPLHAYQAPGSYLVNLTVTDDLGAANTTVLLLRVLESAPDVRAVVVEPPSPRGQEAARFRAIAGDRDGGALLARWSFGDGATSNESEPLHRYARSGVYHGAVEIVDEAGSATLFPFTVVVVNAPPEGNVTLVDGGYALYPSVFALGGLDVDGRIATYRLDADGDGAFDCDSPDPRCAFVYDVPGVYAARLLVEDDEGALGTAVALVDVAPPPSELAPPVVAVESPAPDARLAGEYLVVGTARGVRPIERVELQLRNATWAFSASRDVWRLAEGAEVWRAAFPTRAVPDGPFELVVRATDAGGGVGFARVPVRVENGARASAVQVEILDLPATLAEDALVHGLAIHPDGVTLVRWRLDEGPWQTIAQRPFAFTIALDRDALAPGPHTLRVDAYHGLAESASVVRAFLVPGDAPVIVVDDPPASVAYGLLGAAGRVEGDGRAQWRLDNGLWKDLPPGSSWVLREETQEIEDGPHELGLRAVSPDGRLLGQAVTYPVRVVNPPSFAQAPPEPPRQETPFPLPFLALLVALAAWRTGLS